MLRIRSHKIAFYIETTLILFRSINAPIFVKNLFIFPILIAFFLPKIVANIVEKMFFQFFLCTWGISVFK